MSNINEVADPDEFDAEAYVLSMPDWEFIFYLSRPLYKDHDGMQLFAGTTSVRYRKVISAKSKTRAKKLFYDFIKSLPPIPGIDGNPTPQEQHMRIENIRRVVAESDDVDPEHYLDTSFESPVPGYKIEREPKHLTEWGILGTRAWRVMAEGGTLIGHVMYDPQDDVPPDANQAWKNAHWFAAPGTWGEDSKYFDTFQEAVKYIVHWPMSVGPPVAECVKVAEALLEAEIPQGPEPNYDYDLEDYVKSTDIGFGDLKQKLSGMYDTVKIHVREPTYVFWQNERQWVVTCARSQPMPYPANMQYGTQGEHFKMLVEQYFKDWAKENNLYIDEFKTHGYLRKRVTFTFRTHTVYDKLNIRQGTQESIDDPESFMPGFLDRTGWEEELKPLLWDVHPKSVSINITGGPKSGLVYIRSFFDPAEGDYANTVYDFLLEFFKKRGFPVQSLNLWTWDERQSPYPSWIVMYAFNMKDWKPHDDPPQRTLPNSPPASPAQQPAAGTA